MVWLSLNPCCLKIFIFLQADAFQIQVLIPFIFSFFFLNQMNMHRTPINKAATISFLCDLYEPFYLCIYSCEKIQVHVLESHVMRVMS